MSGNELQRIEVLSEVLSRKRAELSAAAILGLSTRQTRRLIRAYRDGGGGALINKARGRASNNQLIVGVREYVIGLATLIRSDPRRDSHITHRKTTTDISTLHKSGHLNFAPTQALYFFVDLRV